MIAAVLLVGQSVMGLVNNPVLDTRGGPVGAYTQKACERKNAELAIPGPKYVWDAHKCLLVTWPKFSDPRPLPTDAVARRMCDDLNYETIRTSHGVIRSHESAQHVSWKNGSCEADGEPMFAHLSKPSPSAQIAPKGH